MTPELFRKTLSKFCTGVTVVTARNADGIHGLTVNAFSSVSLNPPLILVCITKKGLSHSVLSESDAFVVNILSAQQQEVSNRFANPELDSAARFRGLNYRLTDAGIPLLEDCLGHLQCRLANTFDGGDHTIFIGKVEEASFSDGKKPLLFYESRYHDLG